MIENFLFCLANGIPVRGDPIGTDIIQNGPYSFTIDTCFTNDYSCYETAIKVPNDTWVVVEHYSSKKEAAKGHAKWVKYSSAEQNLSFHGIFLNKSYIFTKE